MYMGIYDRVIAFSQLIEIMQNQWQICWAKLLVVSWLKVQMDER